MIRKWLKFNSKFLELLLSSAASKNPEQKWPLDPPSRNYSNCSLSSNPDGNSASFSTVPSVGSPNSPIRFFKNYTPSERGDGDYSEDDGEVAVAATPAKTELFEIRGPQGAAFLIEAHSEDLEEVRKDLVRMKGDFFHFDKAIIELFTMKCLLTGVPPNGGADQLRLAKVHAISSGCEEVFEMDGGQRFLFVNSVDRTLRAKKMLEKFGYKISGILYRFQPKEKINLEDRFKEVCHQFVGAVEQLPKVISITHNL